MSTELTGAKTQTLVVTDYDELYIEPCTKCGSLRWSVGSLSIGGPEGNVLKDVTCNSCGAPQTVKRRDPGSAR